MGGWLVEGVSIRRLRAGEGYPISLLLQADPCEEVVRSYIRRGQCFVAARDAQTVGVYVLIDTRPQTVELVNVAVAEAERGQGIGKRLVCHAIDTARSMGCRTVEVGTGNSSLGQLALYQKCGFRMVGIDTDFFIRHYPDPIYENGIQCRDMVRLSLYL